MEFKELLKIVGSEPVFHTGFLLTGDVDAVHIRRQLGRWVKAGKVYQLRRGLYALAPPYQKVKPHPFLVANQLVRPSYVSLLSALGYYSLIPEYVPVITSVTTDRPKGFETPLGRYKFQRVKKERFTSFGLADFGNGQEAFLATPEKALLDLVYLQPGGDEISYLRSLRLQNLEQLNPERLIYLAMESNCPKLVRATENIKVLLGEGVEYEDLPEAED